MLAKKSTASSRRFGIELDPGPLAADSDPRQIEHLRQAVLDHGFVVLRDQRLQDEALLALGRRFGDIENRVIKYRTPGPTRKQSPGLWHHHNCCDGALDDWIIYYTPVLPPDGGSIEFFDAAAWYARLDEPTRAWALRRRVRHDYVPVVHTGIPPVANPPWHPMVIERDDAGHPQRAIYAAGHAMEFDDTTDLAAPAPDSPWHAALALAASPGLYRLHDARPHDVIIWDMKMVAHRGYPWPSASLRVIHEVIIRRIFECQTPPSRPH